MKVIELIIHKKVWGATSGDVMLAANIEVTELNTPAPFESVAERPDMAHLARRMKEACEKATKNRRKGMMISSRFRVEQPNPDTVTILHVMNENSPEPFLTFNRIKK